MSISDFLKPGSTPPTAFYFSVKFNDMDEMDSSFQEVSGLKATFGIEEKREGGENSFVHQFPTAPKFENLVFKRCLFPNEHLEEWCRNAFNNFQFDPKDIQIALLGVGDSGMNTGPSKILASWHVVGAFPVSWELAALDITSDRLAIETLKMQYKYFEREV